MAEDQKLRYKEAFDRHIETIDSKATLAME